MLAIVFQEVVVSHATGLHLFDHGLGNHRDLRMCVHGLANVVRNELPLFLRAFVPRVRCRGTAEVKTLVVYRRFAALFRQQLA